VVAWRRRRRRENSERKMENSKFTEKRPTQQRIQINAPVCENSRVKVSARGRVDDAHAAAAVVWPKASGRGTLPLSFHYRNAVSIVCQKGKPTPPLAAAAEEVVGVAAAAARPSTCCCRCCTAACSTRIAAALPVRHAPAFKNSACSLTSIAPAPRKCCRASFSWHSPQFLFVWRSKTQASAFYLQRLLNASELSRRCHPGCLLARHCSCGSSRPSSPSHTIRAETLVFGACHVARTTRQRLQCAQQWPQFHQQFNSSQLSLVLAAPVPIWSQDPYRPVIVASIPPRFC